MQANNRTDAGCTVDAVPYKVLDLEASKLNFAGPDVKATPVMAVPLVLENAPVGVVPFVFPTGWNVPVMFGLPEHQWNPLCVMAVRNRCLQKDRRRELFRRTDLGEQQG